MKTAFLVLLMLLVPVFALAAEPPVQFSMVITGSITVNPEGGVQSYTLAGQDKLPPSALQIVRKTVPEWQFEPVMVDGKPVTARAGMSLRLVASKIDAEHVAIRVAGAEFGCDAELARKLSPDVCPKNARITMERQATPPYPLDAMFHGVGGEVFLVLQIGRDGHVTQAGVRQVNLRSRIKPQAHFRKVLADAALKAARKWRFHVPTAGPDSGKEHWVVQVPIDYTLEPPGAGRRALRARHKYRQWNAYIPGPVHDFPWDPADWGGAAGSTDAVAGGAPFSRDTRFA